MIILCKNVSNLVKRLSKRQSILLNGPNMGQMWYFFFQSSHLEKEQLQTFKITDVTLSHHSRILLEFFATAILEQQKGSHSN